MNLNSLGMALWSSLKSQTKRIIKEKEFQMSYNCHVYLLKCKLKSETFNIHLFLPHKKLALRKLKIFCYFPHIPHTRLWYILLFAHLKQT